MSCLGVAGKNVETKFEWEIGNFFSLSATKDSYYMSPSFVFDNTSLHLEIYPGGCSIAKSGFLSLYLVNEIGDPLHVNNTLHIKKADGTMTGGGSADVCVDNDGMGYLNFYEISCLKQNKSEMIPSGILTIICVLKSKHDVKQNITKVEKKENSQEKQTLKISDHRRLTGNVYYVL